MSNNIVSDSANLASAFKGAMRRLATTVTIVTAKGIDGPIGMTATAVTSVCTEPPALLICVNRSASIHRALMKQFVFCINLLSTHHRDLSSAFGGRIEAAERFNYGEWRAADDGTPFLSDAQSNIFCEVDYLLDYGTHTIVIGKVQSVITSGEVRPLIYSDGKFLSLF